MALRSPLFYAAIYLLSIPFFAFIYWNYFGGSFHAPYAKFEPDAKADLRKAGEILNAALHGTMASSNKTVELQGWKFEGFNLGSVIANDNGGIRFRILFRFSSLSDATPKDDISGFSMKGAATSQTTIRANIPDNGQLRVPLGADKVRFYRSIYVEVNEELQRRDEFYRSAYSYLTSPDSIDKARLLWLTPEDNDILNALFGGLSGDPVPFSGGFWRMAYFRATVAAIVNASSID
jgi:hypothetical protein